jgi:hypothetical protein
MLGCVMLADDAVIAPELDAKRGEEVLGGEARKDQLGGESVIREDVIGTLCRR